MTIDDDSAFSRYDSGSMSAPGTAASAKDQQEPGGMVRPVVR